jgi:hypothetical protein
LLPKFLNKTFMKKLSLFVILLIATCTLAMAQPRAIGGRISYSIGASYQHQIGEKNMLQADLDILGFWYGGQGTVTFNWIFPIQSWDVCSLNWYAGVGVGGGYRWGWWGYRIYGYHHWGYYGYGFVGATGMVGFECNFKFPLQLSVEYRPLIGPRFYRGGGVGFYLDGLYTTAAALSVRYKFGGK